MEQLFAHNVSINERVGKRTVNRINCEERWPWMDHVINARAIDNKVISEQNRIKRTLSLWWTIFSLSFFFSRFTKLAWPPSNWFYIVLLPSSFEHVNISTATIYGNLPRKFSSALCRERSYVPKNMTVTILCTFSSSMWNARLARYKTHLYITSWN